MWRRDDWERAIEGIFHRPVEVVLAVVRKREAVHGRDLIQANCWIGPARRVHARAEMHVIAGAQEVQFGE